MKCEFQVCPDVKLMCFAATKMPVTVAFFYYQKVHKWQSERSGGMVERHTGGVINQFSGAPFNDPKSIITTKKPTGQTCHLEQLKGV